MGQSSHHSCVYLPALPSSQWLPSRPSTPSRCPPLHTHVSSESRILRAVPQKHPYHQPPAPSIVQPPRALTTLTPSLPAASGAHLGPSTLSGVVPLPPSPTRQPHPHARGSPESIEHPGRNADDSQLPVCSQERLADCRSLHQNTQLSVQFSPP